VSYDAGVGISDDSGTYLYYREDKECPPLLPPRERDRQVLLQILLTKDRDGGASHHDVGPTIKPSEAGIAHYVLDASREHGRRATGGLAADVCAAPLDRTGAGHLGHVAVGHVVRSLKTLLLGLKRLRGTRSTAAEITLRLRQLALLEYCTYTTQLLLRQYHV
jgi:hypothetical protein